VTTRILVGDVRERLKELLDASVQCVITSPPYFGLRDYGTADWTGGDAACDHRHETEHQKQGSTSARNGRANVEDQRNENFRHTCAKCGAVRVDRQIGLEPTLAGYVASLVAVFREVKRVLRPDGVCWLNLGSSYSSEDCSRTLYNLREDLTEEERDDICLGMFGLRIDRDEAAGEGSVPEVLPTALEGVAVCGRSGMEGEGVSPFVRETPRGDHPADDGAKPANEVGSDREARELLCVLRGDDSGVLDGGPHQRGRGGAPQGVERQEPIKLNQGVPRHPEAGLPSGQVPGALLQLQLRDRMLGILSTSTTRAEHIPQHLVRYFRPAGPKKKDDLAVPQRVYQALMEDGWYGRQEIIWHKLNPMPESVQDRCTSAHEKVYLLTKRATYYYDADAIREEMAPESAGRYAYAFSGNKGDLDRAWHGSPDGVKVPTAGRNKRNVWTIATAPYKSAHFATFPPKLVEPMILAGTSAKGCCPACGAPWVRTQERGLYPNESRPQGKRAMEIYRASSLTTAHIRAVQAVGMADAGKALVTMDGAGKNATETQRLADEAKTVLGGYFREFAFAGNETTGWAPSCGCFGSWEEVTEPNPNYQDGDEWIPKTITRRVYMPGPDDPPPVPCTVLDPFGGAGTVALEADRLGRDTILIELNPTYAKLAEQRIRGAAPMFAAVEVA
jgi:hypothetical protein